MGLRIEWRANTGKYQSGESAYLGKVVVGGISWSSYYDQTSDETYNAAVLLPGIVIQDKNYTYERGKEIVEHAVNKWFQMCGLEVFVEEEG